MKLFFITCLQWKPVNVITLVKCQFHKINQMITIDDSTEQINYSKRLIWDLVIWWQMITLSVITLNCFHWNAKKGPKLKFFMNVSSIKLKQFIVWFKMSLDANQYSITNEKWPVAFHFKIENVFLYVFIKSNDCYFWAIKLKALTMDYLDCTLFLWAHLMVLIFLLKM